MFRESELTKLRGKPVVPHYIVAVDYERAKEVKTPSFSERGMGSPRVNVSIMRLLKRA